MQSWKSIEPNSDFGLHNLPFGIFSTSRRGARIGVAIGNEIIDLAALHGIGLLDDLEIDRSVFASDTLNDFIRLGKSTTNAVRDLIRDQLISDDSPLREHPSLFVQRANATMHLPVQIGDYTDFYSSLEHATNLGKMFRDPENALLPNWRHLPVGYHGRSSSIVVSGTPIRRPMGQIKPAEGPPRYGPTARLDFELEMAFVIGRDSTQGEPIRTAEAEEFIFGLVLFNDWSARDIQKWEYVPLGPFLGKNFASSISPWIVPLEALAPFKVMGPEQHPPVLPYLQTEKASNYDIALEVILQTSAGEENVISQSNYQYMYWNMSQQLAHHTVNGCNVRVGDLMASGTISGRDSASYGSMLEITSGGSRPLHLADASTRSFLEDGDTVIMRGYAGQGEQRVGFGEVSGQILPAKD